MKIAKKELIEIIKEEIETSLDEINLGEQDFFEPEEPMVIKKTNPGGVDKKGVPLKAPKLPKNWRKLPYNNKIRKDYRNWYKKYGPGSKMKDTGTSPSGLAKNPEVRKTMERADAKIARIYNFHKNRPEKYTAFRLNMKRSWERRSLQSALKLYKKAAQAGNKRAKREIIMVQDLLRGDISSMPKAGQQPDPKPPKKAQPMSAKAAKAEYTKLMRQAGMRRFYYRGTFRNNYRVFYPDEGTLKRYPKLKSSVNTSAGSNPEHRRLIILKKALGN